MFFSRTTGPFQPNIRVFNLFKWRTCPFPRGFNYEIEKIHWQNLKSSSPEPLGQFLPNLALCVLRWKGFKFVQMKGHTLSKGRLYGLLTASGSIHKVCSRKYFTGGPYNPLTSCFLFAAEAMKSNGSHWSKSCKEKSTWQIKKIENKLLSCYNWSGDRITLMII